MSASDQGNAPTPTLEDYFAAQIAQEAGPDTAPATPAPGLPGEAAPRATDAATQQQAAPTQAPPAEQAPPQQPGESSVDYAARVAELERQNAEYQRQIDLREWSSQGRFLKEQKRAEALEARIKELEQGFADEDSYRRGLYDTAIAQAQQAGDPGEVARLTRERDLELRERAFARQQQQDAAARQAREAEDQANQQVTIAQHERTIRTEALPELQRTIDALATEYDLPEEEVAILRRVIDTPGNRLLVQQAPPKFVGAFVLGQMQHLEAEARAAQARLVARNRAAASQAGTYRGPVDTATAPAPQPLRRDPRIRDIDQLADAFLQQG